MRKQESSCPEQSYGTELRSLTVQEPVKDVVGFASISIYGNHCQHLRALGEQKPLSEADGEVDVSPNPTLPLHHPTQEKKLGFGWLHEVTLLCPA